ncbi:2-isopropylmalate synthase [Candidatus Woesearchaeota archaeon]|nr:2-isopropylmalate synthase [Candidatus Woesearchaeota archaeon]
MQLEIMDTTLRDGEQTEGVAFSKQEKLAIAKKLLNLGIHRIEVASAGTTKEEFDAVSSICRWAKKNNYLKNIEVLAFINKKSIDWIYESGCRTANLLCKGSLRHAKEQLGKTKKQHLEDVKKIIKYAGSKDIDVNLYLEDWSNGMKESKDFIYYMLDGLQNSDIKRIMLPDTLGVLSPEQTYSFIKEIKEKFPGKYDFHAHNDYGLATANTIHAVLAGIDGVHATINSLGERTGNASLIEIAVVLKDIYNIDLGFEESKYQEMSDLVAGLSGKKPSYNVPIIGKNVKTQTCGVHADGDQKANLYKTPLTSPGRFSKEKIKYALGKNVGKASIEMNLKDLGIELSSKQIKILRDEVAEIGQKKEQITQPDLLFLIADLFEQPEMVPFKILDCIIKTEINGERSAYVKIDYKGNIMKQKAKGDGGYDAAMNSIKKMLSKKGIEPPKLLDYNVTIPPGGETSALTLASIGWKYNNRKMQSHGIETDQTFAALKATEKILNLILRNGNEYIKK